MQFIRLVVVEVVEVAIVWLFTFLFLEAAAQGYNHWTIQYGARSLLLGGNVVAGARDFSAFYYNPGSSAFIPHSHISIGATGYQLMNIYYNDGAGKGINFKTQPFFQIPVMLGGVQKIGSNPKFSLTLGYFLMQRQSFNFVSSGRKNGQKDIIPEPNDVPLFLEPYFADIYLRAQRSELWGGLAFALNVGPNFGIGICPTIAHRNVLEEVSDDLSLFRNNGTTGIYSRFINFDYYHTRLFLKIGAELKLPKVAIGLTTSLPAWHILGGGETRGKFTVSNLYPALVDFTKSDLKTNLSIRYQTGLSIAIGVEYPKKRAINYFCLQWFNRIPTYNIANTTLDLLPPAESSLSQSLTENFPYFENHRHVINIGYGREMELSENFSFIVSLRTDFSSVSPGQAQRFRYQFGAWDLLHSTLGFSIDKAHSNLSMGITGAFGYTATYSATQLTDPVAYFLYSQRSKASVVIWGLGLVVCYTQISPIRKKKNLQE
ncbi:MAG: hypothetical protein RML72_05070 [Bacteroidia bacterium]|nr:hypothetical protein [Bacteroidia bacterium]MDW8158235.1 hypothetical protein [Bacteroidia bacterium]